MRAAAPLPEPPAVTGFRTFARFESIDYATNRRRFYTLTWQPQFWGGVSLVRTWGRVGSHGLSRTMVFPDPERARAAVERLIRRRLKRRYELTDWQ